jgi:DNA invertase Pin-like site-specific DNA recombinase
MKVVAYLRVSTDKQADEGLGLDVQRAAVWKWARAEGHRIVGEFVDQSVSGSNGIENREALPDALGALRDGRAHAIVVYRLDRLARDLVLQEQLLAEVRRLGVDVFSTSGGESAYLVDDPDDPSCRLIRQILGAVNDY